MGYEPIETNFTYDKNRKLGWTVVKSDVHGIWLLAPNTGDESLYAEIRYYPDAPTETRWGARVLPIDKSNEKLKEDLAVVSARRTWIGGAIESALRALVEKDDCVPDLGGSSAEIAPVVMEVHADKSLNH